MEISKLFGTHLRRLRRAADLTQEDLAGITGVDRTYISELEGGKGRSPSLEIAQRLALGLKTPLSQIIRDIECG
jgi:transcriptional regulator with XRE-family HTH domain